MADRIVLNTISYHGHGAIENIVPELIRQHYLYTGSKLARTMLDDWNHYIFYMVSFHTKFL